MTWVWTALIAVGVVMIAVALWPDARRRGAGRGGGTDADRPPTVETDASEPLTPGS